MKPTPRYLTAVTACSRDFSSLREAGLKGGGGGLIGRDAAKIARFYGGGEAGFPKNLFPLRKSTPAYRTLHHALINHREMMMPIS
jgi:hypothetical protein